MQDLIILAMLIFLGYTQSMSMKTTINKYLRIATEY